MKYRASTLLHSTHSNLVYSNLFYFILFYSVLFYSTLHSTRAPTLSLLFSILPYSILCYCIRLYSALLDFTLLYTRLVQTCASTPQFSNQRMFFQASTQFSPGLCHDSQGFFLGILKKWFPNIAPNFTFPTKKRYPSNKQRFSTATFPDFPWGFSTTPKHPVPDARNRNPPNPRNRAP